MAHALGDATGKEVMRALIAKARGLANAQFWERTFVLDLLTHEGVCRGALVWNPSHGKTLVWAKQTVIATGGAGQIYRETTNPAIATADGHAVAFRAGAELRDMEFMQFHPTVLYIAGGSRHLISEAVRGEGAYLRDCHGHRFMFDHNERGELAPRDVVSQAIVSQMEKTRHPCVYLDLTHLSAELTRARFPHIGKVCLEFGSTSRAISFRSVPALTTWSGGPPPTRKAVRRCRACGRRARCRRADCTGRTGWRRTACWKAWCSG